MFFLKNMENKKNIGLVANKEIGESIVEVSGMYKDWFLDYASYVILERAIPALFDGLKPVQRRILHSMKELHDFRYNKVANIIGHTMQYHPHGDASISDAMIQIGQKDLLIDMQGNWGNILTGDNAAASRYIEARLSKFALEVLFSPKITEWQVSYDGRKKEPIHLPVKFPLLLAQGAEGIAVGLSTKILPHNFNELIQASISYLKGRSFKLYPDFQTKGIIDVEKYEDGMRGGKIRIRAKINAATKSSLVITEIPFSTTTTTLIDSIIKANEKGKIKIKKIEDNTSDKVEILIYLYQGTIINKIIDALYAFTLCEVSISPLCCIIINNKPHFIGVSEILKMSTDNTMKLLKKELEVKLNELEEQWHTTCLERIFIENKIYRQIENQSTWANVLKVIYEGLKPYIKKLKKAVREEDIIGLTEIKIKRISQFDIDRIKKKIKELENNIKEVNYHLNNLIEFAINYFIELKKKYGADKKRNTEIKIFDNIDAKKVVIRNQKLYVNKKEGFVGTSLRNDEYISDCSDIDDIIIFTKYGKMKIVKIGNKIFIEKNIIYAGIFKNEDKKTTYNVVYKDGKTGHYYVKRFFINGITRDKFYDLTTGAANSNISYFSRNPNKDTEIITIHLRNTGRLKKLNFDFDFKSLAIKGRGVKGNILTKHSILKITVKKKRISQLGNKQIWFDEETKRLNENEKGILLGNFSKEDKIISVLKKGTIEITKPNSNIHFTEDLFKIKKFNLENPLTAVYYNKIKKEYFIKRFSLKSNNKEITFLSSDETLIFITFIKHPILEITFVKPREKESLPKKEIIVENFIKIKNYTAVGSPLTKNKIKQIITIKDRIGVSPNKKSASTKFLFD